MSYAGVLDEATRSLLDGTTPLIGVRDGRWCCLLCERQFKSERHLGKHLATSELHKQQVAEAIASGRLVLPAREAGTSVDVARAASSEANHTAASATTSAGAKRARSEGLADAGGGEKSGGGGMSALEQMALFESRLKSQAKVKPDRRDDREFSNVDSNKARTINNQMDWECGECGKFNFARSVVCHDCKAHVDANTKYLSNRLKELKQERFARVFGNSALASDKPLVSDPAAEHAHQKSALTAENNLGHGMLSSMGWQGGGLGRSGEGAAEAVRAYGGDGDRGRASFQC
uniref:G-patch domain-containing protein n=1 Tax=Coccolithus braarudii TaxID=221442 RepID=A0A7S0PXJ7_9EUKA|mmetsp:Transcript_19401/g.41770  ORF Transcript_19401/g.41770 Transcript_19401/m.41770 type:complete len:290 (+) Transcript_19401:19-888(+)